MVATRRAGLTGVWIGARKVSSIGVAVRRWTTWHGLSLNVTAEGPKRATFRPCGLEPGVMTCVADHATPPADDPMLEGALERSFRLVFGFPG